MKNLRLAHRDFSPFTARKLFSDISLSFGVLTSMGVANTAACTRVKSFLKSNDDRKHLPRKVDNLLITVENEEKTGLKTFLQKHAKHFLGYFEMIGCLHLDLSHLRFGRGTSNNLAEFSKVVELCEENELEIGQLEMTARWDLFGAIRKGVLPSTLKKITFVRAPDKDELMSVMLPHTSVFSDCRAAVEKVLRKSRSLECLDFSKLASRFSIDYILSNPAAFRTDNDGDHCGILNLRTLIIHYAQLPTEDRTSEHFQRLQTLIIKDRSITGRLYNKFAETEGDFWLSFRSCGIKLKHLEVPLLSDNLINYIKTQGRNSIHTLKLTSTSAVIDGRVEHFIRQTRRLRENIPGYKQQLDTLAQRFRMEAIPALAASLKHLTLYMRIVQIPNSSTKVNIKSRLIPESAWQETPNTISSENLAGFHDMMNLIKGCRKLESVYVSVWDADYRWASPPGTFSSADELVEGWRYTQVDGEDGWGLWKRGMGLVVEYKHQGYPEDQCARSEYVLSVDDGVWMLERVKRVNF